MARFPLHFARRRVCLLTAAALAIASGAGAQQAPLAESQQQFGSGIDPILDMTPELAPAAEPKEIFIFKDRWFGANSACRLSYQRVGSSVQAHMTGISSAEDVKSAYRSNTWQIANWHWMNSTREAVNSDLPNLCSPTAHVDAGQDSLSLSVGKQAEGITIGDHSVTMEVNSFEYYKKLFGGEYFPATGKVLWPFLSIGRDFKFRSLSDYRAMDFRFVARLDRAVINRTHSNAAGPAPPNASRDYNPRVNATRLELSIPLRWHPRYCDQARLHAEPVCMQNFNKPVNLLIHFYDERWEYFTGKPIVMDGGNHVIMYRLNAQRLIRGAPAHNPFRIEGDTATAQADLLPFMREAILQTERGVGPQAEGKLPPRLREPNGELETDDQYVGDFAINSMGLAYEVSGLSDIVFDIEALSLSGRPARR